MPGIWSPNRVEWIILLFAAARTGLILVNINPAYRLMELEHALMLVGCRALAFATSFKTSDYDAMLSELIPERASSPIGGSIASKKFPELQFLISLSDVPSPGTSTFASLLDKDENEQNLRKELTSISDGLRSTLPYNIQFTSGTTGAPKGATLSHYNLVNNGYFVGREMRLTEKDKICIPVPLYHCFGMVLGLLAAITHGTHLKC